MYIIILYLKPLVYNTITCNNLITCRSPLKLSKDTSNQDKKVSIKCIILLMPLLQQKLVYNNNIIKANRVAVTAAAKRRHKQSRHKGRYQNIDSIYFVSQTLGVQCYHMHAVMQQQFVHVNKSIEATRAAVTAVAKRRHKQSRHKGKVKCIIIP